MQELYRLRSAAERVAMRRESAESLLRRLRNELDQPRRVLDERVRAERAALTEQVRLLEERLRALDRALAEREGLPPAARALAEQGERIALSLLDVEAGRERAVAAALGPRASALVAADAASGFALLERARSAGLGSLTVLVGRDPAELVRALPVVPKEELLSSPVAAVTLEGFGWDPVRGELWFAGETAEALLLELQGRRRELAAELDALRRRAEAPIPDAAYSLERDPVVTRSAERGCAPRARARHPGFPVRDAVAGACGRGRRADGRARGGAALARRGGGRVAARAVGGGGARVGDRRRGRPDRGRGGRGPPPAGADRDGRARRRRRPRGARRADGAARAPPRVARPGEPAREGGVRGREGAPRRPRRPARGSRAEPRRAREAPHAS